MDKRLRQPTVSPFATIVEWNLINIMGESAHDVIGHGNMGLLSISEFDYWLPLCLLSVMIGAAWRIFVICITPQAVARA